MSESVFLDKSLSFRRAETHHATPFSVFAVSVYLEKGGSTEKLLELECGGDLHRSENTFKSRVQKLEEKWVHVGMSKNESWHCAIHEWSANWNVVCIAKNARRGRAKLFCTIRAFFVAYNTHHVRLQCLFFLSGWVQLPVTMHNKCLCWKIDSSAFSKSLTT